MQTKMQTKLTSTYVDITKFPEQIDIDPSMSDNTIGDLHANALLLLNALLTKGIIHISPEDYQAFVDIYTLQDLQPITAGRNVYTCEPAPIFLTDKDLDSEKESKKERLKKIFSEFYKLVAMKKEESKITVIDENTLFRIIGDEAVDRGVCEAFMMLLIALLDEQGANFEILVSNHGMEFVEACEKFKANGNKLISPRLDLVSLGNSMVALNKSIEAGAINAEQIVDIYNKSYKKHLKLVSYSLNAEANEIQVFSHAAIGLNHIRGLAKKFGVPYIAESAADLAKTIDLINLQFSLKVEANQVHTLYTHASMVNGLSAQYVNDDDEVVAALVWNRDYRNLERQSDKFKVTFIHGHDSHDPEHKTHVTLNEALGQFINYTGTLKVYATDGQQAGPANKPGTAHLERKSPQVPPQSKPKAPVLSQAPVPSFDRDDDLNRSQLFDPSMSSLGEPPLEIKPTKVLPQYEPQVPDLGSLPLNQFGRDHDFNASVLFDLDESSSGEPSTDFSMSSLGLPPTDFSMSSLGEPSTDFSVSSLGLPPTDFSMSSLGVPRPTDFSVFKSDDSSSDSEFEDLSQSSLGIKPFDRSTPAQNDNPPDLNTSPDSIYSTLGDAQKFHKRNNRAQNQQEEMDPSFLMSCCSHLTGVEVIGYTLVVALLAIAITALCFATYGVAAAAAVAMVPLVCGLRFFGSERSKEVVNHKEPRDCFGL